MTAVSGRCIAALPFLLLLAACSSNDKPDPYEIVSTLAIDAQATPLSFRYQADLTPRQQQREEGKRQRSRHEAILPPEEPYKLSEPSNAEILREHTALNDMERLLQENALCPKRYAVDSVKHYKQRVEIKGHCLTD
ncbi:hypothetical protein K0504_14150 [Neiella marina]|uniref:Lipoprotein n=1 Tax=Neiella holothuriorum TaxID=2870530 RepID=A0ABS7EIK0_9GAMM|nr:hypothetical protein [Neiella holothuriorum]MBW8192174.1 hypothetical protein [Neiella holothuriorum]